MCIYVSLCACECKSPQSPEEGVRPCMVRVTSSSDPPGVSAKNPLRSFLWVIHSLNLWDISAAFLRNFHRDSLLSDWHRHSKWNTRKKGQFGNKSSNSRQCLEVFFFSSLRSNCSQQEAFKQFSWNSLYLSNESQMLTPKLMVTRSDPKLAIHRLVAR